MSKYGKKLHREYEFRTEPTTAVFQMMIDRPSEYEEGNRDYMLIGSGFFVSKHGLFLTAKHNFEALDGDANDPRTKSALKHQGGHGLVALVTYNGTAFPCPIFDVHLHPNADVGLGLIAAPQKGPNVPPFGISLCAVSKQRAEKNEKLMVYGYQRSSSGHALLDPSTVTMDLNPKSYDGYVVEYHAEGIRQIKWPIYEAYLPIPSGVSGAPVLSLSKNAVIGIATSGWSTSDDDIPDGGMVTDVQSALEMPVPVRLQTSHGYKVVRDVLVAEGLLV